MKLQISDHGRAEIFTNLFQHIKLFTDYINITFDKEKMYIQTMDSGRVSIFEIYLPKAWFDIYEFNVQENIVMGINANVLFKVLNTRHKQQEVNIVFQEGSDILNIHFTNDDKSIFDKHFELHLMEIDTELLQIPNFESDVDISIPSTTLQQLLVNYKFSAILLNSNVQKKKYNCFLSVANLVK